MRAPVSLFLLLEPSTQSILETVLSQAFIFGILSSPGLSVYTTVAKALWGLIWYRKGGSADSSAGTAVRSRTSFSQA